MRKKRTACGACGYVGGALEPRRSESFDRLVKESGAPVVVPTVDVCAGDRFAVDGPTACLRRMVTGERR